MKNIHFVIITLLAFSCSQGRQSDELLIEKVVQMEDQVQRMNIIQLDRGNEFAADIKYEYFSIPKSEEMKMKSSRLVYIMEIMDKIDKETNSIISLLGNYKIDLLKNAGENISTVKKGDYSTIVWRAYNAITAPCLPARLNLMAVTNKSNSNVATEYFVSPDGINPSVKGQELWSKLNDYRSSLVKLTGSYSWRERNFEINPIEINSFVSNEDLQKKVISMFENSSINKNEDIQVLIDLYIRLTKLERSSINGNQVHWVSASFNDALLISAIATLSALEQEILSARALALAHWKGKVSTDSYSFNTIIPLATGPSTSIEGEEVKIQVLMAAFDSDNQPKITTTIAGSKVEYRGDGKGVISFTPKRGLNTIKGTVSIKNKSGVEKTENWEWSINVLPK